MAAGSGPRMPADLIFLRPVSTPEPPEAPEAPERQEWPKPKRPGRAWWHYLVMAVFGPMVLVLVVIGADTTAHHLTDGVAAPAVTATAKPAPKPAHRPRPAAAGHDLASYLAAITGTEEQAFVSSLGQLRADDKAYDFAAAVADAPKLIVTASAWLAVLGHTNPPPAYRPAKLAYMNAATWARRAARTTLDALQTSNFALLTKGQQLAGRAARVLSRAPALAPGAS